MEDVSVGPLQLQVIKNATLTGLNKNGKVFVHIMEKVDQAPGLPHCYQNLASLSRYELYFLCVNSFSEWPLAHPMVVSWLLQPKHHFILGSGGDGEGKSMCLSKNNPRFPYVPLVLIFCVDFYPPDQLRVADDSLRLGHILHPGARVRTPECVRHGFLKGGERRHHGW